ncbi:MAG: zinc-ribbon domain-containing protein [Lachnospiraceae bacterium]|nr:zinc-ribbon domain-containing protein [Lachnospiraceae bacterium]
MFCNKCGAVLKENARFCDKCGAPVKQPVGGVSVNVGSVNATSGMPQAPMSPKDPSVRVGEILKDRRGLLWSEDSPVSVTDWNIRQKSADKTALYISVDNLMGKPISAIYFSLKGYNFLKEEKCDIDEAPFLDLNLMPYASMLLTSYELPDDTIRNVELTVTNVVFSDDTIWKNEKSVMLDEVNTQGEQELIPTEYNPEVFRLMRDMYPAGSARMSAGMLGYGKFPADKKKYWLCGCGAFSIDTKCSKCGIDKELVFRILTNESFEENRAAYNAELERAAEEQRKAVEEQNRRLEQQRMIEQQQLAEQQAIYEQQRAMEEQRRFEKRQQKEQQRLAEQQRIIALQREYMEQQQAKMQAQAQQMYVQPAMPTDAPAAEIPTETTGEFVFCAHCGAKMSSDDIFCPECGEHV